MTLEEILAEAEKLPTAEKMRLLEVLGPRTCCAAMGELWGMHRMLRECMGALPGSGMEAMMHRMMGRMADKEANHA